MSGDEIRKLNTLRHWGACPTKSFRRGLLNSEQEDEECDARDDAMKN